MLYVFLVDEIACIRTVVLALVAELNPCHAVTYIGFDIVRDMCSNLFFGDKSGRVQVLLGTSR